MRGLVEREVVRDRRQVCMRAAREFKPRVSEKLRPCSRLDTEPQHRIAPTPPQQALRRQRSRQARAAEWTENSGGGDGPVHEGFGIRAGPRITGDTQRVAPRQRARQRSEPHRPIQHGDCGVQDERMQQHRAIGRRRRANARMLRMICVGIERLIIRRAMAVHSRPTSTDAGRKPQTAVRRALGR